MELLPEGRYDGLPVDWAYCEIGVNKTPAVQVRFNVTESNKSYSIYWTGFLTDKTKKKTLESLVHMGFRGKDLTQFCEGVNGKALDITQAMSLVVHHEHKDGKTYARVKWVNPLTKFKAMVAPSELKGKIASLNLGADLLEIQNNLGISSVPPIVPLFDELPF